MAQIIPPISPMFQSRPHSFFRIGTLYPNPLACHFPKLSLKYELCHPSTKQPGFPSICRAARFCSTVAMCICSIPNIPFSIKSSSQRLFLNLLKPSVWVLVQTVRSHYLCVFVSFLHPFCLLIAIPRHTVLFPQQVEKVGQKVKTYENFLSFPGNLLFYKKFPRRVLDSLVVILIKGS